VLFCTGFFYLEGGETCFSIFIEILSNLSYGNIKVEVTVQ